MSRNEPKVTHMMTAFLHDLLPLLAQSCVPAAMSKSMLVGRLREAEDQLLSTRQEETMSTLVQTKIKLAQADYVNLELQVKPWP